MPAIARLVIAGFGIHPAFAAAGLFLFPERRFGLQIIHDELAGSKRFTTMSAGHDDQHDLVCRSQLADAMAVAVWNEMSVDDFAQMDLGYAPPFSPVWDPTLIAARKAADR